MSVMVKYMFYNHLNEASAINKDYAEYLDELEKALNTPTNDCHEISNGDFYVLLKPFKEKFFSVYIKVKYEDHEEYLLTTSHWLDIAEAVTIFVKGINVMISRLNGEMK